MCQDNLDQQKIWPDMKPANMFHRHYAFCAINVCYNIF